MCGSQFHLHLKMQAGALMNYVLKRSNWNSACCNDCDVCSRHSVFRLAADIFHWHNTIFPLTKVHPTRNLYGLLQAGGWEKAAEIFVYWLMSQHWWDRKQERDRIERMWLLVCDISDDDQNIHFFSENAGKNARVQELSDCFGTFYSKNTSMQFFWAVFLCSFFFCAHFDCYRHFNTADRVSVHFF